MAASYPPPQPDYSPGTPLETNLWAIVSLISGVLAWLGLFGLGGIAAVISGHIAKNQIRSSAGRMSGEGMATAGLVLGYINIAFTLLGLCVAALIIAGGITLPFLCIPFSNWIQVR